MKQIKIGYIWLTVSNITFALSKYPKRIIHNNIEFRIF